MDFAWWSLEAYLFDRNFVWGNVDADTRQTVLLIYPYSSIKHQCNQLNLHNLRFGSNVYVTIGSCFAHQLKKYSAPIWSGIQKQEELEHVIFLSITMSRDNLNSKMGMCHPGSHCKNEWKFNELTRNVFLFKATIHVFFYQ